MATKAITLKLVVDRNGHKVLFAEASKDFVNFLFYILSLPVSTVVKILTEQDMVGCLGKLYGSIESLSTNYLQPEFNKDRILNPKPPAISVNFNHLLNLPDVEPPRIELYECDCSNQHLGRHTALCRRLERIHVAERRILHEAISNSNKRGFVKDATTYTVMDDLFIRPMSTVSSIRLLSNFNMNDIEVLEINFAMAQAVRLIKASLESNTVLTDVFLRRSRPASFNSRFVPEI